MLNETINKILKEEYFKIKNLNDFEEKIIEELAIYFNKLFIETDYLNDFKGDLLYERMVNQKEDNLITVGAGKKFYDSLVSKGYKKEELFDVIIPIELLTNKKLKKSRQIDVVTKVPIDTSMIDEFIEEYKEAKEKDLELYQKFKRWSDWYVDFHNLIYNALPETDANLFLAAIAFTSVNTALDTNIFEAAKLYKAVKGDWTGGNATREALKFIVNNINSIDSQKDIDVLSKLANANSQYAALLVPKKDTTDSNQKQIREITLSKAKLTNYNNFVKYFIKNEGKLSKEKILEDLKSGVLDVGGTKVYSFFINLIDPDFEWVSIDDGEEKIQPATVDRWMIRLFFIRPLKKLVEELQEENVIVDNKKAQDVFISKAIMFLFTKDSVRSSIVKILNEKIKEYGLDLKAHQLQAFGWVKIREKSGVPSADFESFRDVVNFVKKISDKIDEINPELNFIKNTGEKIKQDVKDVIATINLLSKIPRFNFKNEDEIMRVIKNWKKFYPEYELNTNKGRVVLSVKSKSGSKKDRYFLYPKEDAKSGIWHTPIKHNKKTIANVRGTTRAKVIKAAKDWINVNRPLEK